MTSLGSIMFVVSNEKTLLIFPC